MENMIEGMVREIEELKRAKKAVILAHYYTRAEVQQVADFTGDSLALSVEAAKTDADIILFAGVHFMAETAKLLSPEKKVIIPEPNAGCSLADSCKAEDLEVFLKDYPDHTVVCYVNTTVGVKALTDITCTSSNAMKVINSIPKDRGIVFAPDRNLGSYIKSITGRENMVVWDGACHVHEEFSAEKILELKKQYPEAKVLAHPECKQVVLLTADVIGSTADLLKFATEDSCQSFIVVTESGILHKMQSENPNKKFIPAPPIDSTCGCNDCSYMKMVTLENILAALRSESPTIDISEDMASKARRSIVNMINIK